MADFIDYLLAFVCHLSTHSDVAPLPPKMFVGLIRSRSCMMFFQQVRINSCFALRVAFSQAAIRGLGSFFFLDSSSLRFFLGCAFLSLSTLDTADFCAASTLSSNSSLDNS